MCSPEDVVLLNRFSKETKVVLSGRTHGCAPTVSRKYCAINSNNHITANTFSDAALMIRYLTILLSKAATAAAVGSPHN